MRKNNRKNNKSRPRNRSKKNGLKFRFDEAHHGSISPGSTLAFSIPTDLPKFRIFRPVRHVFFMSSRSAPAVAQVSSYNKLGKRIMATGPITIPSGRVRRVVVNYPSSEVNWDSDSRNAVPVPTAWAVDNLCVRKDPGTDYDITYTSRDYWIYGEEEEGEACPKFYSGVDGTIQEGLSLPYSQPSTSSFVETDELSNSFLSLGLTTPPEH